MAHTDPIADLLTRIRNAGHAGIEVVTIPHSGLKEQVARLIHSEGYLLAVDVAGEGARKVLQVTLKYTADRRPVLSGAVRVSKPGRRVYVGYADIAKVRNGLGVAIVTTPKGVLSDAAARREKVGGEVMCEVW